MGKVKYKLVPGYPCYAVGDDGTVLSRLPPNGKGTNWSGWRVLKPRKGTRAPRMMLRRDGTSTDYCISQLVLLAFVGPCPPGMESCHFPDRDPNNNRLENLRWDTHKANVGDSIIHGTKPEGEECSWAKLSASEVTEIRRLANLGMPKPAIAARFLVSNSYVHRIVKREIWKGVE